jgi:hypothetical protein
MSSTNIPRSLDVVFGASPAPMVPAAPSPLGGATSQGTLSSTDSSLSRGVVLVESVGMDERESERTRSGTPARFTNVPRIPFARTAFGHEGTAQEVGIQPICMFLTSDSNVLLHCMGCVGQKGEKFCTKRRNGSGEQDTCGVQSHTKKAIFDTDHVYYWDEGKHQGYVEPPLSMTYELAPALYDMRGEEMTRVEFKELVGLITTRKVTASAELFEVKERLTKPVAVSFTPRKKPRFSEESMYDYAETDLLPTISEAPEATSDIQDHVIEHWSSMVKGMQLLKDMGTKHSRYETEILRISDDIDTLNMSSARLENLVGTPADGIQFSSTKMKKPCSKSATR